MAKGIQTESFVERFEKVVGKIDFNKDELIEQLKRINSDSLGALNLTLNESIKKSREKEKLVIRDKGLKEILALKNELKDACEGETVNTGFDKIRLKDLSFITDVDVHTEIDDLKIKTIMRKHHLSAKGLLMIVAKLLDKRYVRIKGKK